MSNTDSVSESLSKFADDIASVVPSVDATTDGQYGAGLGSEPEERQVQLLLDALGEIDPSYRDAEREVAYPDRTASCDIVLDGGVPIEAKLLRYWRANGDPEPNWYKHVFSPFNSNTLLTDAKRLHEGAFSSPAGLLGLFYQRAEDDPEAVESSSALFAADTLAEKVVHDIEFWYDFDATVCGVAQFDGLQHPVHQRGAAITWLVE